MQRRKLILIIKSIVARAMAPRQLPPPRHLTARLHVSAGVLPQPPSTPALSFPLRLLIIVIIC